MNVAFSRAERSRRAVGILCCISFLLVLLAAFLCSCAAIYIAVAATDATVAQGGDDLAKDRFRFDGAFINQSAMSFHNDAD